MNRNQVKGTAKQAAGKVQEQAGKLLGNREQEARGAAREQEGKIQKGSGNVKENLKDGIDKL